LKKCFGRAFEQPLDAGSRRAPFTYIGEGEYFNVLPQDFLSSQSFIMARSPETYTDENIDSGVERDVSIVMWFNLPETGAESAEALRWQVERLIKENPFVFRISAFYDERIEDIFFGYVSDEALENGTQYLRFPWFGFRYDMRVAYQTYHDCLPVNANWLTQFVRYDDIDFTGSAGQAAYQDDRLKGKKVRVFRGGVKQSEQPGAGLPYWAFDSVTGTVAFSPALQLGEAVSIEIYGYIRV
jgi:hypothetical protein